MIQLLLCALLVLPRRPRGARVGGYARIMARPDMQGGAGRLGYWNLYGRLLNEGPYAALDFDYDVLKPEMQRQRPVDHHPHAGGGWQCRTRRCGRWTIG